MRHKLSQGSVAALAGRWRICRAVGNASGMPAWLLTAALTGGDGRSARVRMASRAEEPFRLVMCGASSSDPADHRAGRQDDQRPDGLVRLRHRGGCPGDHRVDEPRRRPGAGQRFDQLRTAVHWDGVRSDQEHTPRLQVQPIRDSTCPRGRRRLVHPPAPARHGVPVVLDHLRGCQRDLDLLMGCRHPRSAAPARSAPHSHVPTGKCGTVSSGSLLQARCDPSAPGCLPGLRFPRRVAARAAAGYGPAGHQPTAASTSYRCSAKPAAPAVPPWQPDQPPARPTGRSPQPAPRSPAPAQRSPRHERHLPASRAQATMIRTPTWQSSRHAESDDFPAGARSMVRHVIT
jgi:hypothetical protein